MSTKPNEPELIDVSWHLRLLHEEAGIPWIEQTWLVPRKRWERWVKQLHLVARPEDTTREASNDRTRDSQD